MNDKIIDFAAAKKQADEDRQHAEDVMQRIEEQGLDDVFDPRLRELIRQNSAESVLITDEITKHMNHLIEVGIVKPGGMPAPLEALIRCAQIMCETVDGQIPPQQRELNQGVRDSLGHYIAVMVMQFNREQSAMGIKLYQHDLYLAMIQALLQLLFEQTVAAANKIIEKEEAAAHEVDSTEPSETPEG